jgi:hypothetical protein
VPAMHVDCMYPPPDACRALQSELRGFVGVKFCIHLLVLRMRADMRYI